MRKRAALIYGSAITGLTLLSGCVFQGEESLQEMDPPQEQASTGENNVGQNEVISQDVQGTDQGENEVVVESTERQLYLLDQNGMVVPQTLPLPDTETKEYAKQALEYLVKGGPITNVLPNGFEAVLPAGTEINSLSLQDDGSLIVDVSKEFSEYRPEDELKILQSMTYTLTQFDSVERVKLQINGYDTEVMPVNGTPVSNGYSRANGINLHLGDVVDLSNSESVTVYYPTQQGDNVYYVPVTKRVKANEEGMYETIVQTLVNGPGINLDLQQVFNDGSQLVEEPSYTDGILTLTFNENVLNNFEDQAVLSQEVMDSLVLSLTEQPGVEAVSVQVENVDQVFNEAGQVLTEPVSRPQMVNTRQF